MTDRSIVVRLRAETADYRAKMRQAKTDTEDVAKSVKAQGAAWDGAKESLGTTASLMVKAGTAGAAALVLMTKASIDWESAWAGVTKTVDGTDAELGQLEGRLRSMARSIPATHSEIAAVAEAAGQLGVKTKDVAAFTKVMIDLGETTNLTADEAATSLAQLMNVMGTAPDQVDRLGAAIVDLGNKGASTERDIVQMAQRIAAAGKSVGMSETAVLGYASALASVGVEAEAGGTAISQSFKDIDKAVRAGGKSLELIASTAGMTSAEFRQAWGDDAAHAAQLFVEGLGRMQQQGKDANGVLDELGMTGIRQADSLMRLAQAGGLLASNLANSTKAWDENTALAVEAGKRYETTASKVQVAMNRIQDAAITMGSEVLPIVADLADRVGGLADFFGGLPGPVKAAGVQMLMMGTAGLLAAGGLLKASVAAADFQAKSSLIAGSSTATTLTKVASAAGKAALALTILSTGGAAVQESIDASQPTVGEYTLGLIRLARASGTTTAMLGSTGKSFQGLLRDANNLAKYPVATWVVDLGHRMTFTKTETEQVTAEFGRLDEAIAQLPAEQAQQAFTKMVPSLEQLGADKIVALFPKLSEQYRQQASDLGVLNLTNAQYVDWMSGKMPPAIAAAEAAERSRTGTTAGAVKTQKEMAEATKAATSAALEQASAMNSLLGGQIGYEEAISSTERAIRKNGESTDLTTQKGRENLSALNALASATISYAGDLNETGASQEEVSAAMLRGRDAFIDAAVAAGYGADEAKALADQLGLVPEKKDVKVRTDIDKKGVNAWESYRPKDKDVYVRTHILPSSAQIKMDGGTYSIKVTGGRYAEGGLIAGHSPSATADNIPILATAREFMQPVSSVDHYGVGVMEAIRTKRIPREAIQGYAGGGMVGGRGVSASGSTSASSTADLAAAVADALSGATLRFDRIDHLADYAEARIVSSLRRG